jgi:hypothetical protein
MGANEVIRLCAHSSLSEPASSFSGADIGRAACLGGGRPLLRLRLRTVAEGIEQDRSYWPWPGTTDDRDRRYAQSFAEPQYG